ncbi:MAG: isocitrate lyase/phosphoenolpyruvate mutase family protein [Acidobacteria bacterium]|nr:isocitrate lyase/phosphoenolpyruvate mutase family protein [Acidobacteriota bacterium]
MSGTPARLRALLSADAPVVAPGAFNALFARLIEEAGFDAVYLSGAGVANALLGQPDLGLVTMSEMVMVAERICEVVDVPVIADGDTGYGGVHNVARTVAAYERAGVAAIQIEDQQFPKRCGHFEGKEVVSADEMVERVVAARRARSGDDGIVIIARTDAAAVEGIENAIVRARTYGEAGADLLFVEAPSSRDELAMVAGELGDWPLVANMVEWGRTPLLSAEELGDLGFTLILFPGSVTRTVTRAARETLDELRSTGTTIGRLDQMATFDEVNRVVGLSEADEFERSITDAASDGS